MKKYKPMSLSDFVNIRAGQKITCKIGRKYTQETAVGDAFYNRNADEPGWEVETENGFFCWGDVYTPGEAETAPEYFAVVRWMVEDVQAIRPEWTAAQCREWWKEHEKAFADLLTERGNECLQQMVQE